MTVKVDYVLVQDLLRRHLLPLLLCFKVEVLVVVLMAALALGRVRAIECVLVGLLHCVLHVLNMVKERVVTAI